MKGFVYDYYLKDHLGNTRTTFTTETAPVVVYKATMESENDNQGNNIAAFEEQVFFNLDGTRYTNSTANQSTLADDNCTSCNEVSRTNGSLTANRVGAALLLDVMPGDELDLEVWAYNEGGISTATSRIASSTLVSALVSAFVPGGSGTDLYTQTNSVFTGVSSYLTGGGSSGTTTPFAFLNYIVFDNNFTRLASGHQRVSSTLNAKHLLTLNNINITQKGYVYIWVSNESNENKNTYFDDLKVTHTKGSILQEDHYYPFGMTIASLSNNSLLLKPNKFKYNGFELQEEFDLDWYDYQARYYDPQLGRFMQVDPAADLMRRHSPYNYAFDNPIRFIDPDGMMPEESTSGEQSSGQDNGGCNPGDPCWMEQAGSALATDLLNVKHAFYNSILNSFGSSKRATFVPKEGGGWETGFITIPKQTYWEGVEERALTAVTVMGVLGGGGPTGGLFAKSGAGTSADDVVEVALDLHSIGGGEVDNLKLKPKELEMDEPGISFLKNETPQAAANQMRKEFPRMMEGVNEVGSTNADLVRQAGFEIKADATRRFPNHYKLTHPDGASGFNQANLQELSKQLKTVKINK